MNFLKFLQEHVQIEVNGKIMKLEGLNERGQAYLIGIMTEARDFFSKNMMKRLVFKLN